MNQSKSFNFLIKNYGSLIIIGLLLLLIALSLVMLFSRPGATEKPQITGEQVRKLANMLFEWKLYEQAIEQYEFYLNFYASDNEAIANINYVIGNIYFDRLHDYEKALAHYAKVKYFFPESKLMPDVNKKLFACQERTGRTLDAHQMLEETTSLDSSQVKKSRPGEVIARIGSRKITQGDLDFEIGQLPPYMQGQFTKPEEKKKFLEQYIATELLYDTAKRANFDKDKEVIRGTFQAKKQLMAQKYLEQEITSQVDIKPQDLELYYKANKERYVEKDKDGNVVREKPLTEVRQEVFQDMAGEQQTRAYEALIERLMRAQSVQIFDDKIK